MNTTIEAVFYSAKNYPMPNNKGVQIALLYVYRKQI